MRPRMLILLFTELSREPRAFKQIQRFANIYDVTTVGYGSANLPGVTHIDLPAEVPQPVLVRKVLYVLQVVFFRARLYRLSYWCISLHRWAWSALSEQNWDVIIAHDVNTIPLANRLAPLRGVIVDMHEYAPRQYEHSAEWVSKTAPYYRWICSHELTRAAGVITVSQGIVDEFNREFGLAPVLVTSATPYVDLTPGKVREPIRLVHSGIAARPRQLEIMIEAVLRTATPVTLDLFLVHKGHEEYLAELKALAAGDERIVFHDAVPYADLIATLNSFDVGISIIAATTFNHEWSLPNKFFDYVQARLGIIIGPSPEMARYLDRYKLGAAIDKFTAKSLVTLLDSLNAIDVDKWKRSSEAAARELSGEKQMDILERVIAGL